MAASSSAHPPAEPKPVVFVHNPRSPDGSPSVKPSPVPDTKHEAMMQEFVHAQLMTILQPFVDQLELLSDALNALTAQTAEIEDEVLHHREQVAQNQSRLTALEARATEATTGIQEVHKKDISGPGPPMASIDRLRIHARLYHRRKTDKPAAISTYWEKADYADQSDLRRLAAPVASWIAYGPPGRIPTVEELQLVTKFMNKMDGGPLPPRLRDVLCEMKHRLLSLPTSADEAWKGAEKNLRKTFRELRRACNETVAEEAVVAADDKADAKLRAEQDVALQVRETADSGSPCASVQSDQHLMLFRKMNEWGFLDNAQKLERLQQAEEASKHSRRSLSQEELADVLSTAAACLAAPRRHARLQDANGLHEVRTASESQDPTVDLQKRIRSLLLHALRVWQMNQFDCQAIEHVLDFVQQKISKFENKVGEIQGAAAGKAWLKIKQIVDELLVQEEAPSKTHAKGTTKGHNKVKTRLERQSGIQNISWVVGKAGWKCERCKRRGADGVCKGLWRLFPIAKFLEDGLGEEAAVEAALQEAKAYREELVCEGKLKPPKPRPPRSTVRGVTFDVSKQKWRVQTYDAVNQRIVHCGRFDAKEEAEVKARELFRQLGIRPEYEVRPAKRSRSEDGIIAQLDRLNNGVDHAEQKQLVVDKRLEHLHQFCKDLKGEQAMQQESIREAHMKSDRSSEAIRKTNAQASQKQGEDEEKFACLNQHARPGQDS
eukprot:s3601_g6.t2